MDAGCETTEDPRQRKREACTGGKLQDGRQKMEGGWPRKGEYRISNKEYRMMKCGGRIEDKH